jgi:hypothetical protein
MEAIVAVSYPPWKKPYDASTIYLWWSIDVDIPCFQGSTELSVCFRRWERPTERTAKPIDFATFVSSAFGERPANRAFQSGLTRMSERDQTSTLQIVVVLKGDRVVLQDVDLIVSALLHQ